MSAYALTRRLFTQRWASMCSGLAVACSALRKEARAAPAEGSPIKKLDYAGQPSKDPITPVVVHDGLIYVSGQGANDNGAADELDIATHVHRAMDNLKKLVETAGGDMDHVLELTVFLSTLEFYQAMNKVYATYFPNRAPARCTISVAGIPGKSLVEVSCIAAVVSA